MNIYIPFSKNLIQRSMKYYFNESNYIQTIKRLAYLEKRNKFNPEQAGSPNNSTSQFDKSVLKSTNFQDLIYSTHMLFEQMNNAGKLEVLVSLSQIKSKVCQDYFPVFTKKFFVMNEQDKLEIDDLLEFVRILIKKNASHSKKVRFDKGDLGDGNKRQWDRCGNLVCLDSAGIIKRVT